MSKALFLPHNGQEFDDRLRAIAIKHMGFGQGNPSTWVVQALGEAFQQGFGEGWSARGRAKTEATAEVVPEQARQVEHTTKRLPRVHRIGNEDDGVVDV